MKCPVDHSAFPPGDEDALQTDHTMDYLADPIGFLAQQQTTHGDEFTTMIFGEPYVFLLNPEGHEWVYRGENKYLVNQWPLSIRRLEGEHTLAVLTGDEHRERRRILGPHFRMEMMGKFVSTIEAVSRKHLEQWAADDSVLTMTDQLRNFAFEVISVFIISDDVAKLNIEDLSRTFSVWTAGMLVAEMNETPGTTFGDALLAKKVLMDTVEQVIVERKESGVELDDMLGTFLTLRDEDGQPIPVAVLRDEIVNLLFAGHDTTVTSISNIMMHLAQNPDALAKGREEQAQFDADAPLTFDDIKAMPYLDAIIHESMRILPPVYNTTRVLLEDKEYGEYCLAKDTTVALNSYRVHRDESLWTDPERFDPARFLEPRQEHKQKTFAHTPFGGGPRLCLGQNFAMTEMRVILALMLRHYTFELVPDQDLTNVVLPFANAKSGVQVTFSRDG